jgi:hypothetical protein
VVNGHPPIFLWVKHLTETFIPAVDAALEGTPIRIDWTEAYGGTLAAVGGELEALEDGWPRSASCRPCSSRPTLPLQNVTYFTPFATPDPQLVLAVSTAAQDIPGMAESWHAYDIEYLGGGFALDNYLLMTTFPVESIDDLQGRRIAAPGPAVNWLEGTGAVGVAGNLTTYYNDIQTGVFEGVIVFPTAAAPARLHEVAPYVTITDFGAQYAGSVVANGPGSTPSRARCRRRCARARRPIRRPISPSRRSASAAMETLAERRRHGDRALPEERARWAQAPAGHRRTWARCRWAGLPGTEVLDAYIEHPASEAGAAGRDWSQR